jgi:hypothetical protein
MGAALRVDRPVAWCSTTGIHPCRNAALFALMTSSDKPLLRQGPSCPYGPSAGWKAAVCAQQACVRAERAVSYRIIDESA